MESVIKKIYHGYVEKQKYNSKYKVEGEIKGKKKMSFILAGYKPYLWEDVFSRIKLEQTDDMEICVASSGLYSEELSSVCKKYGWVYISTSKNQICVLTNIVIREFKNAEYIYKLDEDMYVGKDYFAKLYEAYQRIERENPECEIGYICPNLPLGFYCMHEFLVKNNYLEEYEKRFGKHMFGGSSVNQSLRAKSGVDEYVWEKIENFDRRVAEYNAEEFSYEPCVCRPGLAAILFTREFWNRMGGLRKHRGIGIGLDGDEGQFTLFTAFNFQINYVVKNIFVGHFAFGGSEDNVLKFREEHPEVFKITEENR